MPKENRIVHGDPQLKDRAQRLCDIGNLSRKHITSQIIDDCHSDTRQEQKGDQEGIHGKRQNQTGEQHRNAHIDRRLLFGKIFRIRYHRRHPGEETILISHLPNLFNCLHGPVRRCGLVKNNRHHGGFTTVKCLIQLIRHHLHRNGDIHHRIVPQHLGHMLHALNLTLQSLHVLGFHSLHHEHGEGPRAELVDQNVLSYHGFDIFWQVRKNIVIDPG